MKKWYVHDKFDCFGCYTSVMDAAKAALTMTEFSGLHIVYMTDEEAEKYCNTGNLKQSWA
jgi:hypothetical protein